MSWVISARAINQSRNRRSILFQNLVVPFIEVRNQEVRVIQDIEKFRPELYGECLRNPRDVIVFEYGEVEIDRSGPDYAVSPSIAEEMLAGIGVVVFVKGMHFAGFEAIAGGATGGV